MSGTLIGPDGVPVRPRPGIVRALAIINIAGSVLLTLYSAATAAGTLMMGSMGGTIPVAPSGSGKPVAMSFEFMSDPVLIRYLIVDVATALPLNVLMFIAGIGLVNQRRWGATLWSRTAWVKIVRLVLVEGYFVLGVVPVMSAGMARMVLGMIQAQRAIPKGGPTLAQLTTIYGYVYGAMGVGIIIMGVIYPAVSIWLLGRPGVRAVLSDAPTPLPPSEAAARD